MISFLAFTIPKIILNLLLFQPILPVVFQVELDVSIFKDTDFQITIVIGGSTPDNRGRRPETPPTEYEIGREIDIICQRDK